MMFNANFFDTNFNSGDVRSNPCTRSFGLAMNGPIELSPANRHKDRNKIPLDALLVYVDGNSQRAKIIKNADISKKIKKIGRQNIHAAIAGNFMVKNGKWVESSNYPSSSKQVARTAIGLNSDGSRATVVVISKPPSDTPGIKLKELSQLMINKYRTHTVLNLDGSGSSSMHWRPPHGKSITSIGSDKQGQRPFPVVVQVQ